MISLIPPAPLRARSFSRRTPAAGRWFWAATAWAGLTTTIGAQDLSPPGGTPPPPTTTTVPLPLPPPDTPGTQGGFVPRLPAPPTTRPLPQALDLAESVGRPTGSLNVKVGQGRFLTLKEDLDAPGKAVPFVAVGDPSVVDFFRVGPRQLRLIGKRLGTTDLSITTSSGNTYEFEVQVTADIDLLNAQLRQMFPDATLQVGQVREKLVVEGQARDVAQVARIISTLESAIRSAQQTQITGQVQNFQGPAPVAPGADPGAPVGAPGAAPGGQGAAPGNPNPGSDPVAPPPPLYNPSGGIPLQGAAAFGGFGGTNSSGAGAVGPGSPGAITANQIATNQTQVINLIRVPTSQQVLLKVRVAELNRTAFRQIGADFLASVPGAQSLFGSQIAGSSYSQGAIGATTFARRVAGVVTDADVRDLAIGAQGTLYGTFGQGAFNTVIDALRRNNLLKILAEPNLIALNGHQANFLAGGQFPVPVLQGGSGGTGGNGGISVQYKDYGVRLAFLPTIRDNEVIRLTVDPEVSTVDFTTGTTLVPGGSPTPGLNTRSSHTTVELKPGETLAIAGLMQLTLDGQTQRLPGLGDLPYIGAFFSNTTSSRMEKELVVTVTPYLVEPMAPGQVPPGPGDEVVGPNDLEFFLLQRIEGRTAIDNRATTRYDDPFGLIRRSVIEKKYLIGPAGYSR